MSGTEDVDAMKARITELEGELEAQKSQNPPEAQRSHPRGLSVVSAILIVVALVLAPLSVASVWADRIVSDTDQYVKTTEPLIHNPGVQAALTDQVTAAILDNIDVNSLTKATLDAIANRPNVPPSLAAALPGLQGALVSGIDNFVHEQVAKVIASPAFAQVWDTVNRTAHTQVVHLLAGTGTGTITTEGDAIQLNLAPIIEQVKSALVANGFSLAQSLPAIDRSFTLAQSSSLTKAQTLYRVLDATGLWLPLVAIFMLVGGVLLARDRRAALLRASLGLAGAMILLGVVIALIRTYYVNTTPGNVLDSTTAGQVFDTMVRFLRTGLRAVGVLALVLAFAAFVSGPSTAALRVRRTFTGGIGSARTSTGWDTGQVGVWTYQHRTALRVTAALLGGLVLIVWSQPTAWVVLGIALVVLVLLAVIEFVGKPPAARPASAADGPADGEAAGLLDDQAEADSKTGAQPQS